MRHRVYAGLFGLAAGLVVAVISNADSHPPVETDPPVGPNDAWNQTYCNANYDLAQGYRGGCLEWKADWTAAHNAANTAFKNAQYAYQMRQQKQPPMHPENVTYYNEKMMAAQDWLNQSSGKNQTALSYFAGGDYCVAEGVEWEVDAFYYYAGSEYRYSYTSVLEENNEDGPYPNAQLRWAQGIDFATNASTCAQQAQAVCK